MILGNDKEEAPQTHTLQRSTYIFLFPIVSRGVDGFAKRNFRRGPPERHRNLKQQFPALDRNMNTRKKNYGARAPNIRDSGAVDIGRPPAHFSQALTTAGVRSEKFLFPQVSFSSFQSDYSLNSLLCAVNRSARTAFEIEV